MSSFLVPIYLRLLPLDNIALFANRDVESNIRFHMRSMENSVNNYHIYIDIYRDASNFTCYFNNNLDQAVAFVNKKFLYDRVLQFVSVIYLRGSRFFRMKTHEISVVHFECTEACARTR